MSRAILDSSANAPQSAGGGFADLHALDQELASQLPAWDLVPPHSFLVRKPRKPKPIAPPQQPIAAEAQLVERKPVGEVSAVEIEVDTLVPAAEAAAPQPMQDVAEGMSPTNIASDEEVAPSTAVHADNCSKCSAPLEPGSAFCAECGHKL